MEYDELLLEIGEELELTVRHGDFLRVLGILLSKSRENCTAVAWKMMPAEGPDCKFEDGKPVLLTIDLPVEKVLGARKISPQDVVNLFATNEGPSRSVSLHIDNDGEIFFRLVQRYIYDEDFRKRHHEVTPRINTGSVGP